MAGLIMEDTMSLIHLANEVNYGKIYLKAKDSSDQKSQLPTPVSKLSLQLGSRRTQSTCRTLKVTKGL